MDSYQPVYGLTVRASCGVELGNQNAFYHCCTSFLAMYVLKIDSGRLRSLAIDSDKHYVMKVFPSIMTLLGQFEGSLHVPSIQDVHQHTLKTIPYGGVEELEVELDSIDHSNEERHFEFGSQLASFSLTAEQPQRFSLWLWPLYSSMLVSSLSSLIYQLQFMSVSLETTVIPFTLF